MNPFKKILLYLILLTIGAYSADEYFFYVETPEIADSYFNIFNGIAKIFHSGDYLSLLRLVFLYGGFFVFVTGVLQSWGRNAQGAISNYFKYLIGGVALLSIMFSKDTTIVVKSETLPTYCTPGSSDTAGFAVDNIPEILAYSFAFTNRFGRSMTSLAESAYITPNAEGTTSIKDSGGYIGALKQSLRVLSIDINKVTLGNDQNASRPPYDLGMLTRTILSQCILIPFSGKGTDGLDQLTTLKSTSNIFGYLNTLYTDDPLISDIHAREYQAQLGGETWKCGDLWDYVKPYYDQFKSDVVCSEPVGAGALQIITGDLNITTSDFEDTAIQSGLVGELANVSSQLGVGVSGISYATGKTRAEFAQSNMANGEYMAEMLPYLQMTIRAVLYAFLPFIFVIVLLPGGIKVITQYLQTLIWVELWSPTAAILNMFITQQAEYKISSEYSQNGLTVTNAIDMLSAGSTIAGVAGYLYLSVPALTWLIMKGSAHMLAGIGGAVAAGMSKNIQSDSINRDYSTLESNKKFKSDTGEEFSIAEQQHFEAAKTGAVVGATLATEANFGIDTVANAASFSKAKELAHAKSSIERLGGTAETAGTKTGFSSAFEETTKTKGNKRLSGENGENTGLGDVVQKDKVMSAYGEQNAINHNRYDQQMHDDAAQTQRTQIRENAELLRAQVMTHKRIYDQLRRAGYSKEEAAAKVLNRFRQSNAWINSSNHNVAEQMLLKKMGLKGWTNNGKGEHNIKEGNANRLNNFNNREAESEMWNLKKKLGNSETLSANGFPGYEVGKYQAIGTAEQIAQQKVNINKLREEFSQTLGKDTVNKMSDSDIVAFKKAAKVSYIDNKGNLVEDKGNSKTVTAKAIQFSNFARGKIQENLKNLDTNSETYKLLSQTFKANSPEELKTNVTKFLDTTNESLRLAAPGTIPAKAIMRTLTGNMKQKASAIATLATMAGGYSLFVSNSGNSNKPQIPESTKPTTPGVTPKVDNKTTK